jgi:hypothetical protein
MCMKDFDVQMPEGDCALQGCFSFCLLGWLQPLGGCPVVCLGERSELQLLCLLTEIIGDHAAHESAELLFEIFL